MSIIRQKRIPVPAPRLDGNEILIGPDPSICMLKGAMFGARKQFVIDEAGQSGLQQIAAGLSQPTSGYLLTPLASNWYPFGSLIEIDRAIHKTLNAKTPNVLVLLGAASAELGIGKLYRALDSDELLSFLNSSALFHNQYVKFGTVDFEKTPHGGRMTYSKYPCYSPIFCASAIGYFLEAMLRHGARDPRIEETSCQCRGGSSCTFELTWR